MGDQAKVIGLDLSRWNPGWQPEVSISRGVKFVFSRLSNGNYSIDDTFKINNAKAKQYGLPFGAYHVVDPLNSAKSQMDKALTYLKDYEIDRFVLDVELHRNQPVSRITEVTYGCAQEAIKAGFDPIIYTRASWWDAFIYRNSFWATLDLWVAHYGVENPAIPVDWKNVGYRIHQFSADGNFLGKYYGVDSRHVDVNEFNGTEKEMYDFFGVKSPVPEPPPTEPPPDPEPDDQEFIKAYLWKTATRLNIRTRPTTSSSIVRTLDTNVIVEELEREVENGNMWARIGNNQWCAIEYRGNNYLIPIFN